MELSLVNASLKRDDFTIENLSLSAGEGLTAIVGASGSGKTTILTMLSGLIPLDSGKLLLSGKEINGQVPSCGVIFQFPERQLFAETVFSDVSFSLRRGKFDKKDVRKRTEAVLSLMRIDEKLWDESPFSLSGGERRRVAIAGVIVSDPRIVLLDEPTVGLDSPSYSILVDMLKQFRKEGRIVVIVTHDAELASICDKAIWIEKGKIKEEGSPDRVVASPVASLSEELGLGRTVSFDSLIDDIAAFLGGKR